MTPAEIAVLVVLIIAAPLLVSLNVALQHLVRPDRGSERIAGCCGMALPSEITQTTGDDR